MARFTKRAAAVAAMLLTAMAFGSEDEAACVQVSEEEASMVLAMREASLEKESSLNMLQTSGKVISQPTAASSEADTNKQDETSAVQEGSSEADDADWYGGTTVVHHHYGPGYGYGGYGGGTTVVHHHHGPGYGYGGYRGGTTVVHHHGGWLQNEQEEDAEPEVELVEQPVEDDNNEYFNPNEHEDHDNEHDEEPLAALQEGSEGNADGQKWHGTTVVHHRRGYGWGGRHGTTVVHHRRTWYGGRRTTVVHHRRTWYGGRRTTVVHHRGYGWLQNGQKEDAQPEVELEEQPVEEGDEEQAPSDDSLDERPDGEDFLQYDEDGSESEEEPVAALQEDTEGGADGKKWHSTTVVHRRGGYYPGRHGTTVVHHRRTWYGGRRTTVVHHRRGYGYGGGGTTVVHHRRYYR